MARPVHIGCSGWNYRDWRGELYPEGLPQSRWLERYAEVFATVEINATFYRLPTEKAVRGWVNATPDGFTFAVKVSRYLTHIKRLRGPAEPVDRFVGRARGLGAKLGPVLLQLPPQFERDRRRLVRTLDRFPDGMRVAVEFRHDSWFTDDIRSVLA